MSCCNSESESIGESSKDGVDVDDDDVVEGVVFIFESDDFTSSGRVKIAEDGR